MSYATNSCGNSTETLTGTGNSISYRHWLGHSDDGFHQQREGRVDSNLSLQFFGPLSFLLHLFIGCRGWLTRVRPTAHGTPKLFGLTRDLCHPPLVARVRAGVRAPARARSWIWGRLRIRALAFRFLQRMWVKLKRYEIRNRAWSYGNTLLAVSHNLNEHFLWIDLTLQEL